MDAEGKRRVKCPRVSSLIVGFLCCISLGCTLTFVLALNALFNDWMTSFNTNRGAIGSVQAACIGMLASGGLMAALLERRLGRRTCFILGSVLATMGLFSGAFSNSVPVLILTVGIVAGCGFSLTHLSTLAAAMARFPSHSGIISSTMTTVSGLMHLGSPLLFRYLSDQYSWRGCLMIVAGMTFQTILLGVLLTSSIFPSPKSRIDQIYQIRSSEPHEASHPQTDTITVKHEISNKSRNYATEDGIDEIKCSIVPDKTRVKTEDDTNSNMEAIESPQTGFVKVKGRSDENQSCTMKDGLREAKKHVIPDKDKYTAAENTDVKAGEHSRLREFPHTDYRCIGTQKCTTQENYCETTKSPTTVVLSAGNLISESSSGYNAMSAANSGPCTNGLRRSNVNTEESHHTKTRPSQWTFLKNPVYIQ